MQPDRFIVVFIGLLTPFICFAQEVFEPPTKRPIFWATASSAPISIDGDLNEQVWRQTKAVGDFVQKEPVQNTAATYATEVHVAYDENALYIAAICFQPKGETRVQNLQRDFSFDENDLFGIAIWRKSIVFLQQINLDDQA